MSELHPETIGALRARRPDLSDLPDEALRCLMVAAWTSTGLHVRDLRRALLAGLPGPLRRRLERPQNAPSKEPPHA